MTRGRPPLRAQKDAAPVARKRGEVWPYQPKSGTPCDFTIMSPGHVAFVCVKHIRRLRCTIIELQRKFSETIMALRLIASSPLISSELWICSPKGAWRFFRINDESLLELGTDGTPLTTAIMGMAVFTGKVSGALLRLPALGEFSGEEHGFTPERTPVSDIKGV
jgi:hypothetical protein